MVEDWEKEDIQDRIQGIAPPRSDASVEDTRSTIVGSEGADTRERKWSEEAQDAASTYIFRILDLVDETSGLAREALVEENSTLEKNLAELRESVDRAKARVEFARILVRALTDKKQAIDVDGNDTLVSSFQSGDLQDRDYNGWYNGLLGLVGYKPHGLEMELSVTKPDLVPKEDRGMGLFLRFQTWDEAIDELVGHRKDMDRNLRRSVRSKELCRFRLELLEVVLYCIETYGSTEPVEACVSTEKKDSDSRVKLREDSSGKVEENTSDKWNPAVAAQRVFEGKEREKGGANISPEVKTWAAKAHKFYSEDEGMGSERAKDKVLNLAMKYNFEFSRRWLGDAISA